ncbi:unnamed protein product, partial [Rotaria sp. Silwood1]
IDDQPPREEDHEFDVLTIGEEKSSIDDQPPREEDHEFDVLAIEEAQKIDKLYQTKVLEIQANP